MIRFTILSYLGLSIFCSAQVVLTGGDKNNFTPNQPSDNVQMRSSYETAVVNSARNGGTPFQFDQINPSRDFGYSFTGIQPGTIDLNQPVLFEAEFRFPLFNVYNGPFDPALFKFTANDSVGFQFSSDPFPQNDFPIFNMLFKQSLQSFSSSYAASGNWEPELQIEVDLRNLLIPATASQGAGLSIAETINLWGYLDFHIEDDTPVNWIQLSYYETAAIPEPSTVGLSALALIGGFFYLRRRKKA